MAAFGYVEGKGVLLRAAYRQLTEFAVNERRQPETAGVWIMRRSIFGVMVFALAAVGVGQSFNYVFEGLNPGNIVGQDGWTVVEAGTATGTIDNAMFSPMGGSTQSLRMSGGTTSTRLARFLGMTFNSGLVHVGYDMRHSPRIGTGSNLVMSTLYYHNATTTQIFQPYAQNGGGAGAAQNAFADPDGLGGAGYGGTGWIGSVLSPETWYRLEFDFDFGTKKIMNGTIYDISSGSKVLYDQSATQFFFNNDGTNWYDQWDRFGVRLGGQTDPGEGWNIDNFSASVVPEPATFAALAIGAVALLRRKR